MNYNDKINEIIENNKIRSRLKKAGVIPYVVGPTGPRGKGLEIMGNYNSLDDLKREHPTGKNGDTYIVNGELYIWDENSNDWVDVGNIKGPKGDTETFTIGNTITGDETYFSFSDNTNITLIHPGIYEITLCGQISGVDQSHGAIFYLSNANGSVIQDLSFEVKAGTTSRMDCSETIMTKIDTQTTIYVRCGVIGDSSTANIDFANVNLIIKKYNAEI